MAAVAENVDDQFIQNRSSEPSDDASSDKSSDSKSEFQRDVQKLVELLSKLNPSAKEFFPSSYSPDHHFAYGHPSSNNGFPSLTGYWLENNNLGTDGFPNLSNRRKRNNYNQGRRRLNGRSFRAQREDSVRRTVYVSDIDQHVTEERLAALFSSCGQVVDCRVCGDPHSVLRFAFVEFADEQGARAALTLGGTMLGYYPVRVLPSKTAILPVNPTFLPRVRIADILFSLLAYFMCCTCWALSNRTVESKLGSSRFFFSEYWCLGIPDCLHLQVAWG